MLHCIVSTFEAFCVENRDKTCLSVSQNINGVERGDEKLQREYKTIMLNVDEPKVQFDQNQKGYSLLLRVCILTGKCSTNIFGRGAICLYAFVCLRSYPTFFKLLFFFISYPFRIALTTICLYARISYIKLNVQPFLVVVSYQNLKD